jgi:hypothetical protein
LSENVRSYKHAACLCFRNFGLPRPKYPYTAKMPVGLGIQSAEHKKMLNIFSGRMKKGTAELVIPTG